MVEGILNSVIHFFSKLAVSLLSWVSQTTVNMITSDIIENEIVNLILRAFGVLGLIVVGIAVLMSIIKTIIMIGEGQNVSIVYSVKSWLLGMFMAYVGIDISKSLFVFTSYIGVKLVQASNDLMSWSSNSNLFDLERLGEGIDELGAAVIVMIVVVSLLINMFKFIRAASERIGQFFIVQLTMYLYIPKYIYGDDKALWDWLKQAMVIGISQSLTLIYKSNFKGWQ